MGRIILPIESVSRNLNSYRLDSYFRKISRRYLIELKLAKDDCKGAEEKYGVDDCVVCLIEGEDCFPIVEVKIIQTIYKCHKYTLRLPRVDGHANFTANGTNYRYINQVGQESMCKSGIIYCFDSHLNKKSTTSFTKVAHLRTHFLACDVLESK